MTPTNLIFTAWLTIGIFAMCVAAVWRRQIR
jgi:hypothetical protein